MVIVLIKVLIIQVIKPALVMEPQMVVKVCYHILHLVIHQVGLIDLVYIPYPQSF